MLEAGCPHLVWGGEEPKPFIATLAGLFPRGSSFPASPAVILPRIHTRSAENKMYKTPTAFHLLFFFPPACTLGATFPSTCLLPSRLLVGGCSVPRSRQTKWVRLSQRFLVNQVSDYCRCPLNSLRFVTLFPVLRCAGHGETMFENILNPGGDLTRQRIKISLHGELKALCSSVIIFKMVKSFCKDSLSPL